MIITPATGLLIMIVWSGWAPAAADRFQSLLSPGPAFTVAIELAVERLTIRLPSPGSGWFR
jgi:hypothetical protein